MTADSSGDRSRGAANSAQSFYTKWAKAYDLLAHNAPGAGRLRRRAVDALDPDPGGVVLDLGCGTGANFPYLREAVGSSGRVVGIDFSPGPVMIARERARRWENVHAVRGDATRLPVSGREGAIVPDRPATDDDGLPLGDDGVAGDDGLLVHPDAVLASFVIGMLSDPAAAVRDWCELVGPGGRIGLLDLARTDTTPWRVFNPAFAVLTRASAPPSSRARRGSDPVSVLDRRVTAAHEALASTCVDRHCSSHLGGFARISTGTVVAHSDGSEPNPF